MISCQKACTYPKTKWHKFAYEHGVVSNCYHIYMLGIKDNHASKHMHKKRTSDPSSTTAQRATQDVDLELHSR